MARVARACGFGIGDLRFRECPRFVPHPADPANPAKSHKPPNTHKPASPAEAPRVAKPAPRSGRRKASLRDQNPGSEKKRGSDPAKKRASNHPAFRMGLPRYRPQAAPRLAARVPGVSDERPNLPKPKPPTPQSPCLQPRRSPRPGPRTLPRARFANRGGACSFLHMGWKSGQGFWRLERKRNQAKISKARLYSESFRIQSGLLWCATGWPFFV